MAKKQYWNDEEILKTGADILMVLGEKGNGKSYKVKLRLIKNFLETGK